MSLSDFRIGRGLAPRWSWVPPPKRISHVTQETFSSCHSQYPGGSTQRASTCCTASHRPSPIERRVGIHIITFEACSGFTRVVTRRFAGPPRVGCCLWSFTASVTLRSVQVATDVRRWVHQVEFTSTGSLRLSWRTFNRLLWLTTRRDSTERSPAAERPRCARGNRSCGNAARRTRAGR